MTGDELRSARAAMGMTESDLAALLGLSEPDLGMMEDGSNQIDARTAMSVHYLADQRLAARALSGHFETREGDVPLSQAVCIWNSERSSWPLVVAKTNVTDLEGARATGAFEEGWQTLSDTGRLLRLQTAMMEAMVKGEVEMDDVHSALSSIPEYRAIFGERLD